MGSDSKAYLLQGELVADLVALKHLVELFTRLGGDQQHLQTSVRANLFDVSHVFNDRFPDKPFLDDASFNWHRCRCSAHLVLKEEALHLYRPWRLRQLTEMLRFEFLKERKQRSTRAWTLNLLLSEQQRIVPAGRDKK
eukprot:114589-Hanusia_phi.AAC.1